MSAVKTVSERQEAADSTSLLSLAPDERLVHRAEGKEAYSRTWRYGWGCLNPAASMYCLESKFQARSSSSSSSAIPPLT